MYVHVWDLGVGYKVRINHYITLESVKLTFLTYIIPLYIYLEYYLIS